MGFDKLSLPWGRKTILEHCFETLLRSRVQEVVVVLSTRNKAAGELLRGRKAKIAVNPHPDRGMSASIREGLRKISRRSQGILIALGDQPFLKTRTIDALIRAFHHEKGGIIVPSFRGRRGHPVIFHRRFERELLKLKGDAGGRSIIESHPEDVRVVPVSSMGVLKDVDTWSAYKTASTKNDEC